MKLTDEQRKRFCTLYTWVGLIACASRILVFVLFLISSVLAVIAAIVRFLPLPEFADRADEAMGYSCLLAGIFICMTAVFDSVENAANKKIEESAENL